MTKSAPGISLAFLDVSLFFMIGFLISVSPSAHSGVQTTLPDSRALALDSLDGLEVRAASEKRTGHNEGDVRRGHLSREARGALTERRHRHSEGQSVGRAAAGDCRRLGIWRAIEVHLVGLPRNGSPPDTRGFAGRALQVKGHGARFEAFYLRFTNGREDQLRRNHAAQYVSEADSPWFRLREENPGVYESCGYRAGTMDARPH